MAPGGFRGIWREDALARAVYSESAGIERVWPAAVAVPADADDVAALVRWADEQGRATIPRGAGSSMAGAATGPDIVLDLSSLRELSAVDALWQRVRADSGVTSARIAHAAEGEGLRLPVEPSSSAFCTIGGMAATNAAGARSLAFGCVRPWITALDCVFADGTRATVRRGAPVDLDNPTLRRVSMLEGEFRARGAGIPFPRVRKNSSGYGVQDFLATGDLVDLLVGSEGTLAIFTAVELRLVPLPLATATVLAAWDDLDATMRGSAVVREAGAVACELLDRTFLEIAARGGRTLVAPHAEAVLLIELENLTSSAQRHDGESGGLDAAAEVASRAEALGRALRSVGASDVRVAADEESAEALWSFRHAASPALARLDPALKSMQVIEDGCVPEHRLADYVRGVRAALTAHGVRGVLFGHAGDAHVHVNALVDVRDPDWRARVSDVLADVVELTVSLGGTLAGEHGDGRLRTPMMHRLWPADALTLFADIKRAFDPRNRLNPGVKVTAPGQAPLGDIKYDPALPALPPAARRVLDHVSEERAYDRLRLELLEADETLAAR